MTNEAVLENNDVQLETEIATTVSTDTFSITALSQLIEGEHADIRQKIRNILSEPEFAYASDLSRTDYREQVLAWCQRLAAEGIGALSFPKEYGGHNDIGEYLEAFEVLAFHDLSLTIKFGVQFGLFGGCVRQLGTKKHHNQYLTDIGTMVLPGSFAMTELGHGSNVRDIETQAIYDRQTQEFIIHTPSETARKEYIGNAAAHGQMATAFAQLYIGEKNYGVNAFLVPLRNAQGQLLPGIRIEDNGGKMGLNGVDNGRIWFNNVRIPRENLLDRFSQVSSDGEYSSPISSESRRFFTMLGTLVGGRIGIAKASLSAAKSGLAIAVKYAAQRRQFGPDDKPETLILDYQTHQRRLMPPLAKAYATDFALKYLSHRFIHRTEDDAREVEALAAGLKAFSSWNTTQTLQTCREACGGQGYLAVNRFADLKADTDIFTTFEGDNTVLMQLVAKGRLSEFKQQFHDMSIFGLVKYIARQAAQALTELNPVIIRMFNESHLRDSEFHLKAFRYREQDLVISAAKRLKKRLDNGVDSYDAAIQVQDHLVNVGHAYIERVIMEQFVKTVDTIEDEGLKIILKKLCDLFALSQIEQNKGWYLEHGYLEGTKTKAIRRQVDQLSYEISREAVALVDAFAIPDQCLAAPIALQK